MREVLRAFAATIAPESYGYNVSGPAHSGSRTRWALDELARREGISRNQAVMRLLRKGAGLEEAGPRKDAIGESLDWFIGSWTEERAREFEEAAADFERIDEELWK